MEISHAKAREVFGQLQSLKARAMKAREKAEEAAGQVKAIVVTNLVSLGAGYLNAKMGKPATATTPALPLQVMGLDADMLGGLALSGIAVSGLLGKESEFALLGGLALSNSWSNREGLKLGAAAASAASQATGYAVPASQFSGYAVPAGQYVGAAPAGQYAGSAPAGQYR